jgi:valacyclovir hydrolase
MPQVQVGGQTLSYETVGKASAKRLPILLLHGWLQTGRDLLLLANGLAAEGYFVVLPDLPGYGRSTPPNRTYPADFYQRDAKILGAFLEKLGITQAYVMGFSDGGEIALLLPVLFPHLVAATVAWGAVGYYAPTLIPYVRQQMPRTVLNAGHYARHSGQPIETWQAAWIEAFVQIAEAGGNLSLAEVAHTRSPLLLMVGEHDGLNPVADAENYVRQKQSGGGRGDFRLFAGAGHALHDEQPGPFIDTVLNFLASL